MTFIIRDTNLNVKIQRLYHFSFPLIRGGMTAPNGDLKGSARKIRLQKWWWLYNRGGVLTMKGNFFKVKIAQLSLSDHGRRSLAL
jgi:hypothetical protein